MAWCNDLDPEIVYCIEVPSEACPERHHDLCIVTFCRFIYLCLVGDIEITCCEMGTEEIAGEQNFILSHIGKHRFRPVNPGRFYKFQCLTSQRKCLPVIL